MSIWNKLGRSPGALAVTLPSAKGLPSTLSAPAIDATRLKVTVLEAVDPDEPVVAPAPPDRDLLALCRRLTGELEPGYLALLPDGSALDRSAFTIVDGQLRVHGGPVRDQPFVLLEIDLDGDLDPDQLADLAEPRRQLLKALARHDAAAIDVAFREVTAGIKAQRGLSDGDRRRLVAGFATELTNHRKAGQGALPRPTRSWPDFVADLPPASTLGAIDLTKVFRNLDAAQPATDGRTADAVPPSVHWNTRVLDGEAPAALQALDVHHTYRVETKLDPVADDDAAGTLPVEAPPAGASVTFQLKAKQPILRLFGEEPWATRVEGTVTYDAEAGATPALVAELRPVVAGPVVLTLQLVTGNRVRASQGITLTAVDVPAPSASTPTLAPTPAQAAPVTVVGDALTGPPVELRLEISAEELRASSATLSQRCTPASPAAQLVTLARLAHRDLVKLSKGYQADPARAPFGMADGPAALTEMARIGAELHAGFFGRPGEYGDANLQRLATVIAESPAGARVQVVAELQAFPWALFYDRAWDRRLAPADRDRVDPLGFWGHRFRIHRAIEAHLSALRRPVIEGRLRAHPCLNPFIDQQQQAHGVRVLDHQRALFANLPGVDARPPIESDAALVDYLRAQPESCDLLYFFCHATTAQTLDALFTFTRQPADDQAKLVLDASGGTTVKAMRQARPGPLDDAPLVVLNACGSVAGDAAFTSPLLLQFLARWRARGVLGTDWEVPTVFADAFAHRLVHHFLRQRQPLGEALASASAEAFAAGNPFPLIYALYAPPELTFQPGAIS